MRCVQVSETCQVVQQNPAVTRTYYIAAVEESWDYVNGSQVDTLGRSLADPNTPGYTFVHQENGSFIGICALLHYIRTDFVGPAK